MTHAIRCWADHNLLHVANANAIAKILQNYKIGQGVLDSHRFPPPPIHCDTLEVIQICNPPPACGLCQTMCVIQDTEKKASRFFKDEKRRSPKIGRVSKWFTRAGRGRGQEVVSEHEEILS